MDIIIDDSTKDTQLIVGHLIIGGIENKKNRNKPLEKAAKKVNHAVKENPKAFLEKKEITAYEESFADTPSSVASTDSAAKILINLIVETGHLPKISRVVDCMNIVSVTHGIPVSIWDREKVHGTITYTRSKGGEKYWPFMGEEVSLLQNELIAVDDEQVLCLLRYRDSKYAPVSLDSSSIVVHIQVTNGIPAQTVQTALDELETLILNNCGGKTIEKKIV